MPIPGAPRTPWKICGGVPRRLPVGPGRYHQGELRAQRYQKGFFLRRELSRLQALHRQHAHGVAGAHQRHRAETAEVLLADSGNMHEVGVCIGVDDIQRVAGARHQTDEPLASFEAGAPDCLTAQTVAGHEHHVGTVAGQIQRADIHAHFLLDGVHNEIDLSLRRSCFRSRLHDAGESQYQSHSLACCRLSAKA